MFERLQNNLNGMMTNPYPGFFKWASKPRIPKQT